MRVEKYLSKNLDEKINITIVQSEILHAENNINRYFMVLFMMIVASCYGSDSIIVDILCIIFAILTGISIYKENKYINKLKDMIKEI